MTLPFEIARKLRQLATDRLRPLVLIIDRNMRLSAWSGDAEFYGFPAINVGDDAQQTFDFLTGVDSKEAFDLPFVAMPNGLYAHVDIIPGGQYLYAVLMDSSEEHARQQELQQKANELALLHYTQTALMKELEKAKQLADEASEAKGRFIASMSHEFRVPLTSLLGYCSLLRERWQDHQQDLQHLDAIDRGAKHLMALINNVLDQARIEMDETVITPESADLLLIANDIRSVFEPIAAQKKLAFKFAISNEFARQVLVDDTRLRQVLINIVGNAFKYTQEGSVTVDMRWHEGRLRVVVTDTGPGISYQQQGHVFKAFKRADQSGQSGAGLGLSISKRLVELMGGELSLVSEPGAGCAFIFDLPAPEVNHSADEEAAAVIVNEGKVAGQAGVILLAEDNDDIVELIRLYLSEAGYELLVARDGEQATQLALEHQPDLILMDMNMPKVDGFTATRQLRDSGFDNPIVALTASPMDSDRARARQAGCTEYVLKPIEMAQLVALAERLTTANA